MPESFNFSKHLRRIVKPSLQSEGFRLRGTTFAKQVGDVTQLIVFQRSLIYNTLAGYDMGPRVFYVNLWSTRAGSDPQGDTSRLVNPQIMRQLSPVEDWVVWRKSLSKEERRGHFSPDEDKWFYTTEEELQTQLAIAAGQVIERAIPYFNAVAAAFQFPDWRRRTWVAQMEILGLDWLADPDEVFPDGGVESNPL